MSNLKTIANRLKSIEKATGVDKQERLLEEVCEIVRQLKLQKEPLFMQRIFWRLIELTHSEINALGRGDKTLADFEDRFKMSFEDWCRLSPKLDDSEYLHEIARFCDFVGDPCPEWWPRWKKGEVATSTDEIPQ